MNYKQACDILEIDSDRLNDISLPSIKKQYHKLALKHHPDKNGNTEQSNTRFRQINEAYHFFQREIFNDDDLENSSDKEEEEDMYLHMLKMFIQSVVELRYVTTIYSLMKALLVTGKQMFLQLFHNMDKETALHIYIFLSKYRSTIHLHNDLISELREIIRVKYDTIEIYKLNPSIHDLMENNVYKLHVHDQLFLVPLWHNELYYDGSGCEIMVICEPELPPGMNIDEDNHLYVETEISAYQDLPDMIIHNQNITVPIGNKSYTIPLSELHMKSEQYYRIHKQGISKIINDIYNVQDKSDIVIKINII